MNARRSAVTIFNRQGGATWYSQLQRDPSTTERDERREGNYAVRVSQFWHQPSVKKPCMTGSTHLMAVFLLCMIQCLTSPWVLRRGTSRAIASRGRCTASASRPRSAARETPSRVPAPSHLRCRESVRNNMRLNAEIEVLDGKVQRKIPVRIASPSSRLSRRISGIVDNRF